MSELRMKPGFEELSVHDSPQQLRASHHHAAADGTLARGKALKRRQPGLRLRAPADDGFHLFRVY